MVLGGAGPGGWLSAFVVVVYRGQLQNFSGCVKVILLPNNGADEASLLEITLFLTPYFHIRIFRVYQVW